MTPSSMVATAAGVDAGFGSFEWPEGSTYLEDINRGTRAALSWDAGTRHC